MKLRYTFQIFFILLTIFGCNESRVVEPPLEQVRPELTNLLSPPDSAFAFDIHNNIILEFSEPMDVNTFPGNLILWEDETKTTSVEGSFTAEVNEVVFTPSSALTEAHQYFIELKSRVKDVHGNGIDKDTLSVSKTRFFTSGDYSSNTPPQYVVSNGSEDILSKIQVSNDLLISDSAASLDGFGRQLEMAYTEDGSYLIMSDYNTSNSGIYFLNSETFEVVKKITNNDDNSEIKKSAEIVVGNNKAYVVNQSTKIISVVDIPSQMVTSSIQLPEVPKGITLSPDKSKLYVGSGTDNQVWVIDLTTNTLTNTFMIDGLAQSVRLATSNDGNNIIVRELRTNNLFFINSVNGEVNSIIDLGYEAKTGNNNDLAVAGDFVYSSSSDGYLTKINTSSYTVEGEITYSNIQGIDVHPSSEILVASLRETPAKVAFILPDKMEIIRIKEIDGNSPWDVAIRPNM